MKWTKTHVLRTWVWFDYKVTNKFDPPNFARVFFIKIGFCLFCSQRPRTLNYDMDASRFLRPAKKQNTTSMIILRPEDPSLKKVCVQICSLFWTSLFIDQKQGRLSIADLASISSVSNPSILFRRCFFIFSLVDHYYYYNYFGTICLYNQTVSNTMKH